MTRKTGDYRISNFGGEQVRAFVPLPLPPCDPPLQRWIHAEDKLPLLVRAGLAHVQFETIHPFLDGNGRIGRLLIVLLLEHWKLLE